MAELEQLVARWQSAYRRYSEVHETNRYANADDPEAAARIAPSYREVAWLWRQLAAQEASPWWAKAAALHAADTFDHQAGLNEAVIKGSRSTGEVER
ncbi:hypothetical protein ALI22I_35365 [Saccharothrix sp. ALI-22-I]|uniref:hypothetical protein n=1 Tax=Saccharothrix sp. ALI-22-I TaxID=1933778 RepID=UPI00097C78F8|nr:hypothetical protein [Saccharothrix sp. ALI-22-I]ONI83737.1 hypothetical protein ALI22I_35365 [Saccharothrix sp. ALI-22-I]